MTTHGPEKINDKIPHLEVHLLRYLDKNEIVILGSWIETGDILVGKLTPQMVKESSYASEVRLLRVVLGIQVSLVRPIRNFIFMVCSKNSTPYKFRTKYPWLKS